MIKALRRGKDVGFPFGKLTRVRKVSRHWELIGDEPMNPYTVEWVPSWEGLKQLLGREEAADVAGEFMSDPAFWKVYSAEMHPSRRAGRW